MSALNWVATEYRSATAIELADSGLWAGNCTKLRAAAKAKGLKTSGMLTKQIVGKLRAYANTVSGRNLDGWQKTSDLHKKLRFHGGQAVSKSTFYEHLQFAKRAGTLEWDDCHVRYVGLNQRRALKMVLTSPEKRTTRLHKNRPLDAFCPEDSIFKPISVAKAGRRATAPRGARGRFAKPAALAALEPKTKPSNPSTTQPVRPPSPRPSASTSSRIPTISISEFRRRRQQAALSRHIDACAARHEAECESEGIHEACAELLATWEPSDGVDATGRVREGPPRFKLEDLPFGNAFDCQPSDIHPPRRWPRGS